MERPKKIAVVDASVAAKWFVEERFTDRALRMLDDYEARRLDLRSLQIMPFEVLNALRYNSELGQTEIERAGEAISRLKVALYPLLGELAAPSVKTALKYGITIYDASYVSLGRLLNSDLYTADEKLVRKTKGEKTVRHISGYPT